MSSLSLLEAGAQVWPLLLTSAQNLTMTVSVVIPESEFKSILSLKLEAEVSKVIKFLVDYIL